MSRSKCGLEQMLVSKSLRVFNWTSMPEVPESWPSWRPLEQAASLCTGPISSARPARGVARAPPLVIG